MIFVAYPDVLRKAQEEVDAVVGGSIRPPTWSDIQHMPYLRAVLDEVRIWRLLLGGVYQSATTGLSFPACGPAGSPACYVTRRISKHS
jgi:hypothetical protein